MSSAAACDFCAIARGEDPSVEIVAEDAAWVAFFPLDPATPGHTLVISRAHVNDLWALDPQEGSELMAGVIRVGRAIDRALNPDGMNLISSAGSAAEQTVFHLHLHVVPRWRRDGFGRIWPTGKQFRDENLEKLADEIRTAFKDT
jgi:histidine triad (HIT) family protein